MGTKDPRVDGYIAKADGFAKQIPETPAQGRVPGRRSDVEVESSRLHAQGDHGENGLVQEPLTVRILEELVARNAAGGPGRPRGFRDGTARTDRVPCGPDDRSLIHWVREAAALSDRGMKVQRKLAPRVKHTLAVPAWFKAALRRNHKTLAAFEGFSYSNCKEYVEWVTGT